MKKKFLLSLLIILLTSSSSAYSSERAGNVVYVQGDAFVERQHISIKAEKRFELLEEDNVRTEERSRIKMLFRDDSVLTLGPRSRLIIKEYLYSPETKRAESIYELIDGKLRAVVGNAGFKVTTPTAFSAARGTIYLIWYDSLKEFTGIAVLDGEVEAGNIDPTIKGSVIIRKGEVAYIYKNMPPSLPVPFGKDTDEDRISAETILEEIPDIKLPGQKIITFRYPEWMQSFKPPVDERPMISTKINIHLNFP